MHDIRFLCGGCVECGNPIGCRGPQRVAARKSYWAQRAPACHSVNAIGPRGPQRVAWRNSHSAQRAPACRSAEIVLGRGVAAGFRVRACLTCSTAVPMTVCTSLHPVPDAVRDVIACSPYVSSADQWKPVEECMLSGNIRGKCHHMCRGFRVEGTGGSAGFPRVSEGFRTYYTRGRSRRSAKNRKSVFHNRYRGPEGFH